MQFEFQDKVNAVNYCVSLSSKMQVLEDENVDQILRSQYIIDEFDHQKLQRIAEELCDPTKLNIMLRSKSLEGETNQVEEWYSTKYRVEDFSPSLLDRIVHPNVEIRSQKLDLPPPNNLIPKNFGILPKNEEFSREPTLLKQWDSIDLWYKKDDRFDRPKSKVSMKIYTNDCQMGRTLDSRVFVNLWAHIQNEYLREFNYMANCANLSFSVTPMYDNINFTWSGFNDSMPVYIEESIGRLLSMKDESVSESLREIFEQVKEKLLADWKNFYYEQSYQQAFALFESLMLNLSLEQRQMRKHLENYTFEDFQQQHRDWLMSGRYVWYVTGNYGHEEAI